MRVEIGKLDREGNDVLVGHLVLTGDGIVAKPSNDQLLKRILETPTRLLGETVMADQSPKRFLRTLHVRLRSPYLRASEAFEGKRIGNYQTKDIGSARGKPCEQGQAASRTGCIPAEPSTGAPGHEKPKQEPKRAAPGSQLSGEQRNHLRSLGMVGTFPPADVPLDAIKMSQGTAEELKFKPLMQWDQKTKSGRISRQYRYTQEFHDRNAAAKFDRVTKVEPYLDKTKQVLAKRMKDGDDAAAIASIIAETGLRPTDGSDSVKHGHYGIASLLAKHAKIKGDEIHLDFIGKEGVRNKTVIRDSANVAYLKEKLANRAGNEPLWDADSNKAGDALKEAVRESGGLDDVKLKDLRTIKAIQTARQVVKKFKGPPPPLSGNEKKDAKAIVKAILAMSGEVAKVLNNTPTQARDNYIHPEIFSSWQKTLTA